MFNSDPSVCPRTPLAPGIAFCVALAAATPVHAQQPAASSPTVVPSNELAPVVVTATGIEQPIQDVQASVQVIGQKELQANPGTSVTEALRYATGVDARPNGTNTFVAIRGFIANAGNPVLVLIDGLRRTAKYGTPNLNLISTEDVERIEIVRGPISALYGADATGGVINVITKRPEPGTPLGGDVRLLYGAVEGGQRGTWVGGATLRAGTADTGHRLSVEQRSRDLFRYPGTPSYSSDLAKIDELFLTYDGTVRIAPRHALRWVVEYAEQDDTSPARTTRAPITDFTGYERERRFFGALRYAGEVGPGQLSVDGSFGNSKASTTRSYPTIETTDYDQTQLQARYALDLDAHTVVAGAGVSRDRLDVSIVPTVATTTNRHLLLQDEWRFAPAWTLLAGVRHDDFSTFGGATTPRVSVGWSPGPLQLRAGYGEAFRAPSSLEQYSRFVRGRFLILGDPSIQPETNKSWEIAAAWRERTVSAEWVLFRSNVDNLIQTTNAPAQAGDPAGVTTRSTYSNIGQARLQGSELALAWQVSEPWSLTGGWDYLDATDRATGARLVQRARNTFRAGARWTSGDWRIDVRGRYLQDYWASVQVTPPAVTPPPTSSNFGTADFKATYTISRAWMASFGIDNLFDRRQPSNYSSTGAVQDPPGRFVYLSGLYRF
ncbi:MAG: TonB-dependent receptor plug domain-containing protein [Burkholderiaceae bacterium]